MATTVSAKPWVRRALAGKGRHGDSLLDAKGYKRMVEKSLLHEWAHVFQTPEIYNDEATAEAGAAQFARALAPQLIRPRRTQEKRKYDPWRDSLQFGQPAKESHSLSQILQVA